MAGLLLAMVALWVEVGPVRMEVLQPPLPPSPPPPDAFTAFAWRFRRQYLSNARESARRRAIFEANAAIVANLNAQTKDAVFSVEDSPFGDLTTEEFRRRVLMRPSPPPQGAVGDWKATKPLSQHVQQTPPATWDWQKAGAVTSVKDQGFLGTCWAFSAVGAVESQAARTLGRLEDLSVEQLVECDGVADPLQRHADCGSFGGWPYLAFRYVQQAGGLRRAADMPYCAGASGRSQCMPCMPPAYSPTLCGNHSDLYCNASSTTGQGGRRLCSSHEGFTVSVANFTALGPNETDLALALYTLGPLSAGVSAASLQFYHRGIWNPFDWLCDPNALDHAVLLVGYGESLGRPYWRVKNSWGPRWGEEGYFRMARGTAKCGINRAVVAVAVRPP